MPEKSTSAPLWRDPLSSPADRFPLGPPDWHWEGGEDGPSGSETRPFSLRGVVAGPSMDGAPQVSYRFCEQRQIALVDTVDGTIPLLKHTKPGPTPAATSATTDGDPKNPPPEEMGSPDYQTD
jgi:hypothetical protein